MTAGHKRHPLKISTTQPSRLKITTNTENVVKPQLETQDCIIINHQSNQFLIHCYKSIHSSKHMNCFLSGEMILMTRMGVHDLHEIKRSAQIQSVTGTSYHAIRSLDGAHEYSQARCWYHRRTTYKRKPLLYDTKSNCTNIYAPWLEEPSQSIKCHYLAHKYWGMHVKTLTKTWQWRGSVRLVVAAAVVLLLLPRATEISGQLSVSTIIWREGGSIPNSWDVFRTRELTVCR